MYISIRKYKLTSRDAKTRGELTRQINELFLPQISKAPGFVSYYAVDDGSGTLATVSVFETQSGAEESNRQAADTKKNLPALVSGPPEITRVKCSRLRRFGQAPSQRAEITSRSERPRREGSIREALASAKDLSGAWQALFLII